MEAASAVQGRIRSEFQQPIEVKLPPFAVEGQP
jgi:hypothetical protein